MLVENRDLTSCKDSLVILLVNVIGLEETSGEDLEVVLEEVSGVNQGHPGDR